MQEGCSAQAPYCRSGVVPKCAVPVCRPGSDMEVVHKASSLEAVPELIPELEALTSSLQATDVSQCVWVLGAAMRAHGAAGSRGNVFVANASALVCLRVEYMLLAWAGWPSILMLPFCGQLSCSHWVARCQLQPLGGRTAPDLPAHPSPAGSAGFPKRAAADYRGLFHAGRAAYAAPLLFAHHTSGHGAAGACTVQPVSVPLFNDVACVCAFQRCPCTPLIFTRLSWSATAGTRQSGGVGGGNFHCTERAGKGVRWHAVGTGGCAARLPGALTKASVPHYMRAPVTFENWCALPCLPCSARPPAHAAARRCWPPPGPAWIWTRAICPLHWTCCGRM